MYIAAGQGQTTPGDKILMSTETSCYFGHLLQVSKNLFEVWFYTYFFHDFIHVYNPKAGADNPLGTTFLCQHAHLVTLVICCKFQKNLFWSLILYNPFHDFIHVYSPGAGQGQTAPGGQSFDVNINVLSLHSFVASFKTMSLKSDFIQMFSWFYTQGRGCPKAGADNPLGMKLLCQQEHPVTLVICCKFQKNLSEVWFYTIFSWFYTCI